jgi:hypothetical protein
MKLLIMQFLELVTSSLFGPNILLSVLFSNILGLRSYLNVRETKFRIHISRNVPCPVVR